jgi:hypothetical protein
MPELLLDAAGRRRSPATLPSSTPAGRPRNNGLRYPADPPSVEEIVTVMRRASDGVHARRLRGLIVVVRRALASRSARRSRSPRSTSIRAADLCWCGAARAVAGATWGWTTGRGSSSNHGSRPRRAAGRTAVLASSTVRPADGRGQTAPPARKCGGCWPRSMRCRSAVPPPGRRSRCRSRGRRSCRCATRILRRPSWFSRTGP